VSTINGVFSIFLSLSFSLLLLLLFSKKGSSNGSKILHGLLSNTNIMISTKSSPPFTLHYELFLLEKGDILKVVL
jgi:hypothetical protein